MRHRFLFLFLVGLTVGTLFLGVPHPVMAGFSLLWDGNVQYDISPDQQQIAMIGTNSVNGRQSLLLTEIATGQQRILIENDPLLRDVIFVPDGQGLLISRIAGLYTYQLYYYSFAERTDVALALVVDKEDFEFAKENFLTTPTGYDYLFRNDTIAGFTSVLYRTPLDGSGATAVGDEEIEAYIENFSISPDGSHVVVYYRYKRVGAAIRGELGVISLQDNGWHSWTTLTNNYDKVEYLFTPDGSRVIFQKIAYIGPVAEIFEHHFESGDTTRIASQGYRHVAPFVLSPNGEVLLYISSATGPYSIYAYSLATHQATKVYQITGPAEPHTLYASPDGKTVVLHETIYLPEAIERFVAVRYDEVQNPIEIASGYTAPLGGGSPIAITASHLLYRTDEPTADSWLYGVPLDGSQSPYLIHDDSNIKAFLLNPATPYVYYVIEKYGETKILAEPIIPNKEAATPLYYEPQTGRTIRLREIFANGQLLFTGHVNQDLYLADSSLPWVRGTAANLVAGEGESLGVTIFAESASAFGPITIPIEIVGGTAIEGEDYILVNDTVTIPRATLIGNTYLTLVSDGQPEAGETIILQLGNPVGARLGEPRVITITVYDELFRQSLPLMEQ